MNKAKLLKMYIDGEHVNKIAAQCGCTTKTVYKIASAHGLHRTGHVKAIQPKPQPKSVDEPIYREIPEHAMPVQVPDKKHKRLMAELRAYRASHTMPWYLK